MEYDNELHELLQTAIDEGRIDEESAACGVAKFCITHGYHALSKPQQASFNQYVVPHLQKIIDQREIEARMRGMPD